MRSPSHVLRQFSRTWAQRIAAVEDTQHEGDLPLGAARLLYEIGTSDETARSLRTRLDLDSGYLSRLLRRLEDDDLVTVEPDPEDRRRRTIRLTPAGQRAYDELEQRAEEIITDLIAPLTPRQRDQLVEALSTAELLMRASAVCLDVVDPASPAARYAMSRYFAELDGRFPGGFDPGPDDDVSSMAPPTGVFVLATSAESPVGCGGVQAIPDGAGGTVAEIKRMWVDESLRGAGLGSRMLRRLEREAAALGHRVVRLDTHRSLDEAIAMYTRAGYREIARYNDNPYAEAFFEKVL